jgi:hypothetical protein
MTTETLDEARERLRPFVERAQGFSGWADFPHARPLDSAIPWDYVARARELAQHATRVLDIGTGGAERFAGVIEGLEVYAVATEEWPTNVPVAAGTLAPIGGQVVHCQDELLPFRPESFDLILNRHSALDPVDITRILTPGGTVLTQQVGNDNWDDIKPFFPQKTDWGDHYTRYREGFRASGLVVTDERRHSTRAAFSGLGEFVYCLCVANWEAPGMDPLGKDLPTLLAMERDLSTVDGFVVTETHYIIEAHKPD